MVDTNVLSELRTGKNPILRQWMSGLAGDLCISSITVAELQFGASTVAGHRPGLAAELEKWIDEIVAHTPVISLGATESRLMGRMQAVPAIRHPGTSPRFGADLGIAATAIVAGCALATLNHRDFRLIAQHFPALAVVDPLGSDQT